MTQRTLHPLLQRLAALVLLGVGLGGAVAMAAGPMVHSRALRDEARAHLDRLTGLAKVPLADVVRYDQNDLTSRQADDAEAQIALQSGLDGIAKATSLATQSVQPLGAENLGDLGRVVWVEVTLTGDLQALVDLLKSIDAERPIILVRRLDVERGEGARPDAFLRIRMEAGRIWRPGSKKP